MLDAGKADDVLKIGEPFNPISDMLGLDPFEFKMFQCLSHVMGKQPFYNADNVEAMNIVLDKIQGPFLQMPQWTTPVLHLMRHDPLAAFRRAYAGIITELNSLYSTVRELPPAEKQLTPFAII